MSRQNKKPESPKPSLVIVEWFDAFDGQSGWVDMDEYTPKPVRPLSVGWLIPEFMEDHITLMGSYLYDYNDDNSVQYSTASHIPIGMVQSITYLDVPANIKRIHNL